MVEMTSGRTPWHMTGSTTSRLNSRPSTRSETAKPASIAIGNDKPPNFIAARTKKGQHHELALREVDRLRRLPQQHEADSDQRVDAAGCQAGEKQLQNVRQRFTSRRPAWAGSGRSSACPRRLRPGS